MLSFDKLYWDNRAASSAKVMTLESRKGESSSNKSIEVNESQTNPSPGASIHHWPVSLINGASTLNESDQTSLLHLDFAHIFSNVGLDTGKDDLAFWMWKDSLRNQLHGSSEEELEIKWQETIKKNKDKEWSRWTTLSKGILHLSRNVLSQKDRNGFGNISSEQALQVVDKLSSKLNLPLELCYLNQRSIAKLEGVRKRRKKLTMNSFRNDWKKFPSEEKSLWEAKAVEFAMIAFKISEGEAVCRREATKEPIPDEESSMHSSDSSQTNNQDSNLLSDLKMGEPNSLLDLNLRKAFSTVGTDKSVKDKLAFFLWKDHLHMKQMNSLIDEELVSYWQNTVLKNRAMTKYWIELSSSLLSYHRTVSRRKSVIKINKNPEDPWQEFMKPSFKLWRLNERSIAKFYNTELFNRREMEKAWRKLPANEKRAWEAKAEECVPSFVMKGSDSKEVCSRGTDALQRLQPLMEVEIVGMETKGSENLKDVHPATKAVRFTRTPADNSRDLLFIPCLTRQPNKTSELQYENDCTAHPYQAEIETWKPSDGHIAYREPSLPSPMKDTPLLIVDSEETLETFMDHISSVSEIAVDVEHHSEHSFLGHTCILQISTRTHDFIIDWLCLGLKLESLNQVLTDPKVLKVLHGSDSDILWLQRDCGIYVVGLFDTYLGAKEIGLDQHGLNYLLQKYCNVTITKKLKKRYQTADWRLRPLPPDMVHYARQDTHYLLYIHDVMKNQLLQTSGIETLLKIYNESNLICLQRYKKPECNPELLISQYEFLGYDHCQRAAFIGLHEWRDSVARELDESLAMVMTDNNLLKLAENLPITKAEVLKHWKNRLELGDDHVNYLEQIKMILLRATNAPEQEPLGETAFALWKAREIKAGRPDHKANMRLDWSNLGHDIQKAWRWAARTNLEESKNNSNSGNKETYKKKLAGKRAGRDNKQPEFSGSESEEEEEEESLDEGVGKLALKVARMEIVTPRSNSAVAFASKFQMHNNSVGSYFDSSRIEYRSLPVIPSVAELMSKSNNQLPSNKLDKPFLDADDYVNTQFRLLREDFLRCLKVGVQSFVLKNGVNSKVRFHNDITVHKKKNNKKTGRTTWTLLLSKRLVLSLRDAASRFLPGHLLLFTADNGNTFYFAIISDEGNCNRRLEVDSLVTFNVHFCNDGEPDWNERQLFTTLECEAYFEPYRRVLFALQSKQFESFPLTKYLVAPNQQQGSALPSYLHHIKEYKLGNYIVNPSTPTTWPGAKKFGLDHDQYEALKCALIQELAVIQGPPGTGKTYLGVQIIKILMENRELWKAGGGGPIIVMCYTNHALDQILGATLDLFTPENVKGELGFILKEPKIIRLGGGSQSERVADYKWTGKHLSRSNADVVFVTTTGAAKRFKELNKLRSRVMIVEEAAEVFEAHIAAAFTAHLEQLILLGDHQQLRPICATNRMCDHNLDVSLFERLVRANFKRCTLTQQHRMRPQIRDLISGTIYKKLRDHPSVLCFPKVDGMAKNLFFLDHQYPEASKPGSFSKFNQYEAEMVVQLAEYLILEGYEAPQIVVLATYMSQVNHIKTLMEQRAICTAVSVETADSYQGEENDIVLLSMVRSNTFGDIGFMRTDNRTCVALSRARLGLYIVGNMGLLCRASPTWRKINAKLLGSSSTGPAIELNMCKTHGLTFAIQDPGQLAELMQTGCAKCLAKIR